MMLMDGQCSHIGFDTRCRLLSALLAVDDEAGDEDMEQTERPAIEQYEGVEKVGQGIRIAKWRES